MPLPLTFLEDITEEMTYFIAKGSTSAESQGTATNTSIIMKYLIIINNHKDLYKLHLVLEYWLEFLFVW